MPLSEAQVLDLVKSDLLPAWKRERESLDRIDRWLRWDHDRPHAPRTATKEYRELADRSQTPWGAFLVSSLARTLYVEGYRRADAEDDGAAWRIWQANRFDAHQVAIHSAAIGYGVAYGLVLPGTTLGGESMPKMRGVSPREMIALYEDPADDEWPYAAMRVAEIRKKAELRVYDDGLVHTIDLPNGVKDMTGMTYRGSAEHDSGVCPVVRFTNRLDLEGRLAGEIEPHISVLARLDQDTFDRLVVQRFASWVVRTIAGMSPPASGETEAAAKLRLAVENILVAEDKDTKFGSLPASPLNGFIEAHDADVRVLAAVAAAPAHEMLGQMANLSAEALAAARAPQTAKSDEAQHVLGASHEQMLRLAAHIAGDAESAADFSAQVRWKDTEIRSLAQAADALGKLATMLNVPVELLWEKVPGFTDQDVERAKALLAEATSGGMEGLLRELAGGQTSDSEVADLKTRADAFGVLVRAGADPAAAAVEAGLSGLKLTGAVPVSLRLPEGQAQGLEG